MNEATLQNRIRHGANEHGARLMRNQVGSYELADGRRLSSGLCKGSSDLIGWQTIKITPAMVGKKIAVFAAVEVKLPGRRPTPEQQRFIDAVVRAGGIGLVAHSVLELGDGLLRFSQHFDEE